MKIIEEYGEESGIRTHDTFNSIQAFQVCAEDFATWHQYLFNHITAIIDLDFIRLDRILINFIPDLAERWWRIATSGLSTIASFSVSWSVNI